MTTIRWDPDLRERRSSEFAVDHPFLESGATGEMKEAAIESGSLLECPECFGIDLEVIIEAGVGVRLGGEAGVGREYPYFDRSLGMRISSARHHREVQRAMGIEQADNAMEASLDEARRRIASNNEAEQQYQKMLRQQASDPDAQRTADLFERVQDEAGSDPRRRREALSDFMRRGA